MREIKFRAWDIKRKEMFYIDDLYFFEEEGIHEIVDGVARGHHAEYKTTQYVGLKDKEGKRIFEGDIVRISDHPFEGAIGVKGNYEVGYNEYMELCCGSWILHRMRYWAEVIGNIYENPELLNGVGAAK